MNSQRWLQKVGSCDTSEAITSERHEDVKTEQEEDRFDALSLNLFEELLEVRLVSQKSSHCVHQNFARSIFRHEALHASLTRFQYKLFPGVHGEE
jgi:hypothetical protein